MGSVRLGSFLMTEESVLRNVRVTPIIIIGRSAGLSRRGDNPLPSIRLGYLRN